MKNINLIAKIITKVLEITYYVATALMACVAFCAAFVPKGLKYFMDVEKDIEQLTSSVIRVFKTRYPMDYEPVIEDIVADEILFYAHAVLRVGIEDNVWYKVGKSKNLGLEGLSKILWGIVLVAVGCIFALF